MIGRTRDGFVAAAAVATRKNAEFSFRIRAAYDSLPRTHGRRLFSRGGEEYLKICSTPQNGFRGGDTFFLCRGGVEGGGRGGTNQIVIGGNWDFLRKQE